MSEEVDPVDTCTFHGMLSPIESLMIWQVLSADAILQKSARLAGMLKTVWSRRALSRLDFTKRTDRMSHRKLVGSQLFPSSAHRLSKAVFEIM